MILGSNRIEQGIKVPCFNLDALYLSILIFILY